MDNKMCLKCVLEPKYPKKNNISCFFGRNFNENVGTQPFFWECLKKLQVFDKKIMKTKYV